MAPPRASGPKGWHPAKAKYECWLFSEQYAHARERADSSLRRVADKIYRRLRGSRHARRVPRSFTKSPTVLQNSRIVSRCGCTSLLT